MEINSITSVDFDFLMNSIYKAIFKLTDKYGFVDEEIKILMPKWFSFYISHYNISSFGRNVGKTLFNKQILPHYKNEIVVYYENYSMSNNEDYYIIDFKDFIRDIPTNEVEII